MSKKMLLSVLLIVAAVAAVSFRAGRVGSVAPAAIEHDEDEASRIDDRVVASVQVAPIRNMELAPVFHAFGSVIAQPGEVKVLSVQFESRVTHVGVIAGQPVEAGAELIEIEPSPDTVLQLSEADRVAAAASADLDQAQRRFDARLATSQDLFLARQNLESAKLKAMSLRDRGAGAKQQLRAEKVGIVSKISVQEGQIVPAGGGAVEVAPGDRIEVRLGLDPMDAAAIKVGSRVKLRDMDRAEGENIEGTIRLVTRKVNPDTRSVDAYVSVPQKFNRPLDASVLAEVFGESKTVLVAPREAVIPGSTAQTLFTVVDGKAVEHHIATGIRRDGWVEVISDELKEGDVVVVAGGAELEPGMRVKTVPSSATTSEAHGKEESTPKTRALTTGAAS